MEPNMAYTLLFVENPQESEKYYSKLLGLKAVESYPTFVLFAMPNGVKLGLWSPTTAEPKVTAKPGAAEICFPADDVDAVFKEWKERGAIITQEPTDMDFGRTFLAVDPDGHRIRVFKLAENPR